MRDVGIFQNENWKQNTNKSDILTTRSTLFNINKHKKQNRNSAKIASLPCISIVDIIPRIKIIRYLLLYFELDCKNPNAINDEKATKKPEICGCNINPKVRNIGTLW